MRDRLLITAPVLFFCSTLGATEAGESIGYEIGRTGRQVHDSVQDAGRFAAETTQITSDRFVDLLSIAGESLSGAANEAWSRIDLFFYDIRNGYQQTH